VLEQALKHGKEHLKAWVQDHGAGVVVGDVTWAVYPTQTRVLSDRTTFEALLDDFRAAGAPADLLDVWKPDSDALKALTRWVKTHIFSQTTTAAASIVHIRRGGRVGRR
jgi:hypothetical protein